MLDPVLHVENENFCPVTRHMCLIAGAHYQEELTLTAVGELLGMNAKYIGRVFLQDTGMRFSHYLTGCRMLAARKLIESTTDKIATIAFDVGYTQTNNFYVDFRQYFGCSPSSFRV